MDAKAHTRKAVLAPNIIANMPGTIALKRDMGRFDFRRDRIWWFWNCLDTSEGQKQGQEIQIGGGVYGICSGTVTGGDQHCADGQRHVAGQGAGGLPGYQLQEIRREAEGQRLRKRKSDPRILLSGAVDREQQRCALLW